MDVSYRNNLLALSALSFGLLVSQPTRTSELQLKRAKARKENPEAQIPKAAAKHPQANIYRVYFFITAGAWLQECFLYTLYQKDYGLSAATIFQLSLTSLAASSFASVFGGFAADYYGRKSLCVLFTGFYGLSICLNMIPNLGSLFIARAASGIATAITYSVLDSWVVTDFFARKLTMHGCDLYRTFGTMAVVNAFAGVASAVLGERLIWVAGSTKAPYIVGIFVMWQAMQAVWSGFKEVYGASSSDDQELVKSTPSLFAVLKRPYIWAFTFATTAFEGATYLFAYSAMPILRSVHKTNRELPYIYIFACVATSALVGALTFNIVMRRRKIRFMRLLSLVLLLANFVFYQLSKAKTESATFRLYCLFGACVGLYWPCIGTLKARLIEEGIRSTVYSAMRAPAYLFVIYLLVTNTEPATFSKVYYTTAMSFGAASGLVFLSSFNPKLP